MFRGLILKPAVMTHNSPTSSSSSSSSSSSYVEQLRTSSVRISFCRATTCIFNPLASGRVTIVTMHSLRRLIHWTVTMFYSETDYRKCVALL